MTCHKSWNSNRQGPDIYATFHPLSASQTQPRCMAAGILACPPIIIPSSVKLQTHSLAPLPLLFPIQVSEYPVILSVENHCGIEQQRVMAQHLNHILGDKLLKNTLNGKAPVGLPSPEVNNATFF